MAEVEKRDKTGEKCESGGKHKLSSCLTSMGPVFDLQNKCKSWAR